jgi:lysophospholipase L1-like esterase
LALGDSYTIGEGVAIHHNFPYQTVQLLRKAGYGFYAPEIIAKTGWTTDELQDGIKATQFLPVYDMVSLCIGVNNQYRGRSADEYRQQFTRLLEKAIDMTDKKAQHVFVLSIPDWGVTPFANGRDKNAIAREIDTYNAINKTVAGNLHVNYIDITPGTRLAEEDGSLLAADKLHPSEKEYEKWAMRLAEAAKPVFKI